MKDKWEHNFITKEGDIYIAWDETQANELGEYNTFEEAVEAIRKYAKTLNPEGDE